MWTKETRAIWRRAKAASAREDRIISGYVREKYKKIYGEAAAFYNQLNAKYPDKIDLRKVKEYKALSHLTVKEPKRKYPDINVNRTRSFSDNLQLRIPLLQTEATPPTDPIQNVEMIPDPIQNVEITTTPELVLNVTQEAAAPTSDLQFGQIDDAVIDRMVSELQKDPDLQDILDDIKFDEPTPADDIFW